MAAALPGGRLRPHVKAHKCTALAARQAAPGHTAFTCATIGARWRAWPRPGSGDDLLLANEVVDATRLGVLVAGRARVSPWPSTPRRPSTPRSPAGCPRS